MAISEEQVKHIAKLSSLNLNENEVKNYAKDLEEILNMANAINEVNTDDVPETIGVNNLYNAFRKDEVNEERMIDKEVLLSNAPSQDEGMFRVPKVIN